MTLYIHNKKCIHSDIHTQSRLWERRERGLGTRTTEGRGQTRGHLFFHGQLHFNITHKTIKIKDALFFFYVIYVFMCEKRDGLGF